jgi:hypothetical protein
LLNTITQNLQRLQDARDSISEAIKYKGGTVNSGDGYEDFTADIGTIPSTVKVYGYHVNPNESDPSACITYIKDAVGMTPAAMGSTTFDYGSWEDVFFMPKPCMVKYDGTVDYFLDPNDYSKKEDGTTSDVANLAYEGNAMMQWPKIYWKYEAGTIEGEGYFYCSNTKIDNTFNCWCNIDSENNEIDYFYTSIYNGTFNTDYSNTKTYRVNDLALYNNSLYKANTAQTVPATYSATNTYSVGDRCLYSSEVYECNTAIETAEAWTASHWTKLSNADTWNNSQWDLITSSPVTNMRSISGIRLAPINGNGNTSGSTEETRAKANNTNSNVEWYISVWADRILINGLLILISKSLNCQAKFGNGVSTGSQTVKENYITGSLDNKGLFYGDTSGTSTAVKVFGMENWWSLVWDRTAGVVGTSTGYKYKLTYNTADGSTAISYNSSGTNYLTLTITRPSSNNYVSKMIYGNHGYLSLSTTNPSASSTTYYCDYYYGGNGYLLVGGSSSNGPGAGFSYFTLGYAFSSTHWSLAARLSLKPLGSTARA